MTEEKTPPVGEALTAKSVKLLRRGDRLQHVASPDIVRALWRTSGEWPDLWLHFVDDKNSATLCDRFTFLARAPAADSGTEQEPKANPHYRALEDIIAERLRQVSEEGWTPEHDDAHEPAGALAYAAACYAQEAGHQVTAESRGKARDPSPLPHFAGWPWDTTWWKPGGGARRCLVKAGALILAQIEHIDRAGARQ